MIYIHTYISYKNKSSKYIFTCIKSNIKNIFQYYVSKCIIFVFLLIYFWFYPIWFFLHSCTTYKITFKLYNRSFFIHKYPFLFLKNLSWKKMVNNSVEVQWFMNLCISNRCSWIFDIFCSYIQAKYYSNCVS